MIEDVKRGDAKRKGWLGAGLAGAAGIAVGAAAVAWAGVPGMGPGRAAVEATVHDYLMAHPEVIPQAMARLQEREANARVAAAGPSVDQPFPGAWAGNPRGDVTLVEFFDYNCGYCRQTVSDIERLLTEDKRLRVVFRELPVLSQDSDTAARASLSAAKQGRFLAFHRRLFGLGHATPANIQAAARATGLDPARIAADVRAADVEREIGGNLSLAQRLGVTGTPSFVVGGKMLSGAVGYDALKAAIAEARSGTRAG